MGFRRSEVDKCLYISEFGEAYVYILVYIDNIIIAGNNERLIEQIKKTLKNEFHVKNLSVLQSFLGIDIERLDGESPESTQLLTEIIIALQNERLQPDKNSYGCNAYSRQCKGELLINSKPYRELVRCLMYVLLATQPDLSFAVNYFS